MREEGVRSVLVNSNPATIMTDLDIADAVYIEPLTVPVLERIIAQGTPGRSAANARRADGTQPGRGAGERRDPRKVQRPAAGHAARGDSTSGRPRALPRPSREARRATSWKATICTTLQQCIDAAETIGLPVVIRPAYTLGGTGGGMAFTTEELIATATRRPRREPNHAGARREEPPRLEGNRIRGDARRRRQLHHHLQHGELRPDGRAHRRLHRRSAVARR